MPLLGNVSNFRLSLLLGLSLVSAEALSLPQTIDELREQVAQYGCSKLIEDFVAHIKAINLSTQSGPPLNAISRINDNVYEQARALEKMTSKERLKKPLYCVPVLLKDNIDSYDSSSTSGSLALLGNQPTSDPPFVKNLREAGAVILGKTTMDEFASGTTGISGGGGRVGNAFDPTKNPGGSSSGSAVAVSANMAVAAIGTDNSGSVRIPAAYNGLTALRPSKGLVSEHGIFPRGNIDGVAGPMARNVADLAVVLDALADKTGDLVDSSYASELKPGGLEKKRIGIVSRVGDAWVDQDRDQALKGLFDALRAELSDSGATLIDNIELSDFHLDRSLNEAGEAEEVNEYLSSFPSVRRSYRDICESKRTKVFGESPAECLEFISELPRKDSQDFNKAKARIEKNKRYIHRVLAANKLDALLLPVSSTGVASYEADYVTEVVASNSGLPGLTFNIGLFKNLPVGVELVGKRGAERDLIAMVYDYQHERSAPQPNLPEDQPKFAKLSIQEYNNLLAKIGYESYNVLSQTDAKQGYEQLRQGKVFREIVAEVTKD